MANDAVFTRVDPELLPELEELRSREPIFHTQRFGRTVEEFERSTAADFWEVGASGRRYSRAFILGMRSKLALVDADAAGWKATGFGVRRLGPDCFLLTYHAGPKWTADTARDYLGESCRWLADSLSPGNGCNRR